MGEMKESLQSQGSVVTRAKWEKIAMNKFKQEISDHGKIHILEEPPKKAETHRNQTEKKKGDYKRDVMKRHANLGPFQSHIPVALKGFVRKMWLSFCTYICVYMLVAIYIYIHTCIVFVQMDYRQYNQGRIHHALPALECSGDRKLAVRFKVVPFL